MATVNVPERLSVAPMKLAREAGVPAVEVDFGRLTPQMILAILSQGSKYFIDAALSHAKVSELPDEERAARVAEVIANVTRRFYDPEWRPARRESAAAETPEERALREVLSQKWTHIGYLIPRKTKAAERVTYEDLVAKFGGPDEDPLVAYRAIATEYNRRHGRAEEEIAAGLAKGEEALRKQVAALVKARQAQPSAF